MESRWTLTSVEELREQVARRVSFVLPEFVLPELPTPYKGKVRDVFKQPAQPDVLFMVTSDRASAFDHILNILVPFKGAVLNEITKWAFERTKAVVPNSLVAEKCLHPNLLVQRRLQPIPVEFIMRAYLWGSMAEAYERGERMFCGVALPAGMARYDSFAAHGLGPLLTPTTKAEVDENLTLEQVEHSVGVEVARKAADAAKKLFDAGTQIAKERGLILIDTKYEFALDNDANVVAIDEVASQPTLPRCF
eukprot:GHVT01013592.1.p1 GENE.GHVT01013592.1~~GHVT01013592.1.p1  ORF type:complete len:250 (+),score=54.20 GHVT01013592.1:343-1092(+)